MAIPSTLSYGTVVGRFLAFSSDGPDADLAPDEVAASGTITFVCSAGALLDSEGLSAIITSDIVCTLDAEGYLCGPNGQRGVQLYATDDPNAQPVGWTWTAIFDLTTPDGTPLRYLTTKPFLLPANTTVDLFYALPVAKSKGAYITKGDKGDPNTLSVGSVTVGEPAVSITGDAPSQVVSFSLPVNNLAIGEVTTGPGTPGIVGPQGIQGIQGLKGEPGGFVEGTQLFSTTNLNTITSPGVYRQVSGSTAAYNYPGLEGTKGILIVHASTTGTELYQEWQPLANHNAVPRVFYRRSYYAGVWSAWRSFNSSRVDQTAGRAIYQWDELNQREQLIYGDTGFRNIASLLDPAVGTAISIQVRRIGHTVEMVIQDLTPIADGNPYFLTLPDGFKPNVSRWYSSRTVQANDEVAEIARNLYVSASGILGGYTLKATDVYRETFVWTTAQAWPTTLPGVALGTIPNT